MQIAATRSRHQDGSLELPRCPHCNVAQPLLSAIHSFNTSSASGSTRKWRVYTCSRCGGAILGATTNAADLITEIYPKPETLEEGIPTRAAAFLQQALESIHAPSGCIMLCASSVDAMLKEKGLKKGSLYSRVEQAAKDGLITSEMSLWAHEVRLDANDERHADEEAALPQEPEARRCIEFTRALAMFLFILPAMVESGRKGEKPSAAPGIGSPRVPPPSPPPPSSPRSPS